MAKIQKKQGSGFRPLSKDNFLTLRQILKNSQVATVFYDVPRSMLVKGDCREVLGSLPVRSIDCVITSPPYWQQRDYEVDPQFATRLIGHEEAPENYVRNLVEVFGKVKLALKDQGSLWLNIGDKYHNKNLMGMPWRVALALQEQGWILRNDVIWYSMKGTQSAKDRFRDVYEHIFHFVKSNHYYFDQKSILVKPNKLPTMNNGRIVSATGVNGARYRTQILQSTKLNDQERTEALKALDEVLMQMKKGEIVDFRMTIRGQQRILSSDSKSVSGRAKELEKKGFYIIKSHTEGFAPPDIWHIVPEDEVRNYNHYAAFPVELLKRPIKSTCPEGNGIVLDPFVGTGTAVLAAVLLNRRGIGIDISTKYLDVARERLSGTQLTLM